MLLPFERRHIPSLPHSTRERPDDRLGFFGFFPIFGTKDLPLAGEKAKKTTTGKSFFNVQDANVTGTSQGLDNFVTQGYIAY